MANYENSNKILPNLGDKGYTEFYLNPRPNAGLERIVRGIDGKTYYTPDHYKTFIEF